MEKKTFRLALRGSYRFGNEEVGLSIRATSEGYTDSEAVARAIWRAMGVDLIPRQWIWTTRPGEDGVARLTLLWVEEGTRRVFATEHETFAEMLVPEGVYLPDSYQQRALAQWPAGLTPEERPLYSVLALLAYAESLSERLLAEAPREEVLEDLAGMARHLAITAYLAQVTLDELFGVV